MSHPLGFTRRPGEAFDDVRVEDFVRSRAQGCSIKVSAEHAGISPSSGRELEKNPDVLARRKELDRRNTVCTVSLPWIVEELKKNALEARESGQFKASNEALELIYELLTKNSAQLIDNVGESLPRAPQDMRAELRKRLGASSSAEPIVVPGVQVESEEVH